MNHQPKATRHLDPAGEAQGSSPPLREFSPQTEAESETARAPWSAFIARILRPASETREHE